MQRCQRQWEHVKPVEQVGAEPALGDFGGQIPVCAGDYPDIDFDRLGRADWYYFTFLQGAQQLGLQGQWHFGDFVEQQRAAIGRTEKPFVGFARPGEGALLVAEQQSFQHGLWHGRAVDGNKGLVLAGGTVVDEAAQNLFAGAGRAVYQNGDLACR